MDLDWNPCMQQQHEHFTIVLIPKTNNFCIYTQSVLLVSEIGDVTDGTYCELYILSRVGVTIDAGLYW
jgi:hypothetical protein